MSDSAFSKKDHTKYDLKSREEGKILLKEMYKRRAISDNANRYGPDLLVGKKTYFEVEYKTYGNIPMIEEKGLHIAQRKQKYYNSDEMTVHHITFLDDYNKAIIFKNKELRDCPVITKTCRRGGVYYNDSKFLEIGLNNALRFQKKRGKWKRVKQFT
jgi:hypothetical protein